MTAVAGGASPGHADHRRRHRGLGARVNETACPASSRPSSRASPHDLLLRVHPAASDERSRAATVVTAGTESSRPLQSLFPPASRSATSRRSTTRSTDAPARARAPVRRPAPPGLRAGPHRAPRRQPRVDRVSAAPPALRCASRCSARHRDRADRGGLADRRCFGANADLVAAGRRLRRPAVRLDRRARRSASASGCSWTSRCCRRSASRSLVLLAVGYGAGRLRELRDPQAHARRRSPSARAATAVAPSASR